ncbi:MAG: sulfate permease [Alphaproteobacteria bacterium]|nr:sulfate permease [Alphaproteobacteria bacterium]
MKWRTIFPFLVWGREYDRGLLAQDMLAALIVTIMLVPQSLAYAMLAGLPAHVGLYASILPLIAYAAFGSSRTLAVGPVAVVSLMTAAAAGAVAAPGSLAYQQAALALALLSGVILAAMAILRLGVLANFLSHPVISGFISASGILIAVSQLRHLLGLEARGDTLSELLPQLAGNIGQTNLPTLAIGLMSLAFLFWVRRRLRPLLVRVGLAPRLADILAKAGPVFAVIASILAVRLFDLTASGVRVVGDVPAGLPPLALPSFDPGLWLELLPAAVLISLVGFVESVSVAQTLAARRRQRIDANQELVGLGAANFAASFSGGFPVTGGFARSVVNFDAGAATPLAGAFTAIAIALATLLLAPLFADLPQAVLAATIVVAVLSLVDIGAMRRVLAYSRSDFAAMALTILLVLLAGIEAGILGGVMLSLLLFLWRTSRPHMAVVGQVPGSEHFRNVERHRVVVSPTVLSLRVDESLYFANARYLEERVYDLVAARPGIRHVVLMCPAVNFIDASALESLEAIVHRLHAAGVEFHLSEVKGPVMDRLARSDFLQHLTGRVFLSQHQAMRELDAATSEAAASAAGPATGQAG